MSEPGAQSVHTGDSTTLRIPTFPPRAPRRRRSRIVLAAALVLLATGVATLASRTQEATWFFPASYVADPASSTVTVLVREQGCDSGTPPSITRPRVELSETTVAIAVHTRARLSLGASCQEDPLTPVTIGLGEPLGSRTLVDAHGDLDNSYESVPEGALGPRAPVAAQR